MVKAARSALLIMIESLLEVLIVALNAPAQLRENDQTAEGDRAGKHRESVFGRFVLALRSFDRRPLLRPAVGQIVVVTRGPHAHAGKV